MGLYEKLNVTVGPYERPEWDSETLEVNLAGQINLRRMEQWDYRDKTVETARLYESDGWDSEG